MLQLKITMCKLALFSVFTLFATGFLIGHEHPRVVTKEVVVTHQVPVIGMMNTRATDYERKQALRVASIARVPAHKPAVPK